jgi:hypothetical protein
MIEPQRLSQFTFDLVTRAQLANSYEISAENQKRDRTVIDGIECDIMPKIPLISESNERESQTFVDKINLLQRALLNRYLLKAPEMLKQILDDYPFSQPEDNKTERFY